MLAFGIIGISPIGVRLRRFRIDVNGFAVASNGFVMLAFGIIGISPIGVRLRRFRIDVNGLP